MSFVNSFIHFFKTGGSAGISDAPQTIDDLFAWFDADSQYVTLSGSDVTQWTDRISGYYVEQTGSAVRPTYATSAVNGKPALNFNGSTDYLFATNNATNLALIEHGSGSFEQTVFVVGQNDSGASGQDFLMSWGETSNATDYVGIFYTGTGLLRSTITATTSRTQTGIVNLRDSENHILTIQMNKAGTSQDWYNRVDGDYDNVTSLDSTEQDANIDQFNIGKNIRSNSEYLLGSISEILIYNRILTDAEVTTVENYLFDKYFNPYNFEGLTAYYQANSGSALQTETV